MRAGELDRIATIERVTITKNEYGEQLESWNTLAIVPARLRPIRGTERFMSEQTVGGAEVVFTIRFLSGIDTMDRVKCQDVIYDITGVLELGRREGLELYAKSRSETN